MLETPKEKLLSCMVYKKQRRAMLFSGIMSISELDFVIIGMKSIMSQKEIEECELELLQYEEREQCSHIYDDEKCELFSGHPGKHIIMTHARW